MLNFDRLAVASRLRGLLAGQDNGVIGATANRLGVSELALRMSVDERDPHPTFEVLGAIVRHYAVDPTWLVTGEYDAASHRQAIEDDAMIAHLLARPVLRPTPKDSESVAGSTGPDQPKSTPKASS